MALRTRALLLSILIPTLVLAAGCSWKPRATGSSPPRHDGEPHRLRWVIAALDPQPGIEPVTTPWTARRLWPLTTAVITETDIDLATDDRDGSIYLEITEAARMRVRNATADNIGRVMIVWLDDEMINVWRIDRTVDRSYLWLSARKTRFREMVRKLEDAGIRVTKEPLVPLTTEQ